MKHFFKFLLVFPVIAVITGCQELPGEPKTQGAVIGGAAGAAVGAAVAKENRWLGALIGSALGAGGGYIIAAKVDQSKDPEAAAVAARKATENPATAEDALRSMTADLNLDGFVTLDEVVAMKQAGFSDQQMISRLRQTDAVFALSSEHQNYLRERGVSDNVIAQMQTMNRDKISNASGDVVNQPTAR